MQIKLLKDKDGDLYYSFYYKNYLYEYYNYNISKYDALFVNGKVYADVYDKEREDVIKYFSSLYREEKLKRILK